MADRVSFLNTRFDRMTPKEAVESLLNRLLERQGGRIYYGNAHTLVTASQSSELVKSLAQCDLLLADGSGVRWGSAWLGTPLIYNLNGTDLVPNLCQEGAKYGLSIYLLGSKPGVAQDAADNLTRKYPGLKIAGVQDGYFTPEETPHVLENIRRARPHLLMVGMGVPTQEIWIAEHADSLPNITCMAVGGLFDFLAERVPRAPLLFRATGMEWSWRLMVEPSRLWKRYLIGNLIFLILLITYALTQGRTTPVRDKIAFFEEETLEEVRTTSYNQVKSA